jgi:hypothetical protein
MDWLVGDTITALFDSAAARRDTTTGPVLKRLVASGHASSLYHIAPGDTTQRIAAMNYMTARLITINLNTVNSNQQKVATVTTVDSVRGLYIEPRPDTAARRARAGTTPAKPKPQPKTTVPSVVPLPAKPPTRP